MEDRVVEFSARVTFDTMKGAVTVHLNEQQLFELWEKLSDHVRGRMLDSTLAQSPQQRGLHVDCFLESLGLKRQDL